MKHEKFMKEVADKAAKAAEGQDGDHSADKAVDVLSEMWNGVDGPMAKLRSLGLSPEVEKWFWGDFEDLLDNLKAKIPGVNI